MSIKRIVGLVVIAGVLSGCAGGLNSMQKREYSQFEMNNVLIEEKNPSLGVALGFLPGGGSFYAREYGYGILNLLLWPASILWDPVSGYNGSRSINYDLTTYKLEKDKKKELTLLEDKLATGELDSKGYVAAKREVENKYDY